MPAARPARALAVLVLAAFAAALPATAADAPDEVAVHEIRVRFGDATAWAPAVSKEDARRTAEGVRAEVTKPGADFAAFVRTFSEGNKPGAPGASLFSIVEVGAGEDPVVVAAAALPLGGVSGVIEGKGAFHVVRRVTVDEARAALALSTAVVSGVKVPFSPAGGKGRSKEDAAALAKKAAAALKAGSAPRAVAAEAGIETLLRSGMPIVLKKGLVAMTSGYEKVEETVWALPPGGVADPVEAPGAWWVVVRLPWFHAYAAHLVVPWQGAERAPKSVTRTKAEARARAEEALAKLKADPTSWAAVVAVYSEEPGAASREGRLGLVEPGTLVPEFEAALAAMPPKSLSGIVETAFGFHVLRRLD